MAYQMEWSSFSKKNLRTLQGQEEQELEMIQFQQVPIETDSIPYAKRPPKRLFYNSNFDYRSAIQLGRGGFGDAYLVKHKLCSGQKFVLKRFRIGSLNDVAKRSAWKELHALQYLRHFNICKLYGAFCSDVPTLVLEACYGTASDFIYKLDTLSVVQILVQISGALEFMHNKDFIHCDVKPANILIRSNNTAVLADFGSCIFLDGKETYLSDFSVGTPAYMNYESLRYGEYSRRTDFWALACTAFKLEQKDHVVPPPDSDVRPIDYYADIIRTGVKLPGGEIKPFRDMFLLCKKFAEIMHLLTDDKLSRMSDFLTSSELRRVLSRFHLTIENINEVDNKFADRYIRLDISAELPFHNISKPSDNSFAEYYFEDDEVVSFLATKPSAQPGIHQIPLRGNENEFGDLMEVCGRDLQVETVDIASDSSSAKAQGKTTLTHNLNSSLATGIQVESNKSQELQKNDKMISQQPEIEPESLNPDEINRDTEVYLCLKCHSFICLSLALMRAHKKNCNP